MKVELGTIKEKPQRINWKEWEKREGKFLITGLFGPNKYPSGTLSFFDEEKNLFVKKSLNVDKTRELFKLFKDFVGDIYLIIKKEKEALKMEISFEERPDSHFIYIQEGKNIIRRDTTKIAQREDIPF